MVSWNLCQELACPRYRVMHLAVGFRRHVEPPFAESDLLKYSFPKGRRYLYPRLVLRKSGLESQHNHRGGAADPKSCCHVLQRGRGRAGVRALLPSTEPKGHIGNMVSQLFSRPDLGEIRCAKPPPNSSPIPAGKSIHPRASGRLPSRSRRF